MSAEEENELIALKSRLWKLGLDRNNPESTLISSKTKLLSEVLMLLRFCPSTRAMWSLGIGKFYSTATATKKWMKALRM